MTFTQRMQSIVQEAAAIRRSMSIGGAGDTHFSNDGFRQQVGIYPGGRSREAMAREAGARMVAELLKDCLTGRRPMWHLREAMTTSDFPKLFGDNLYRMLLGNYVAWPTTYQSWCNVTEVNDFRTLKMMRIEGGRAALSTAIGEYEPYPEVKFVESQETLAVAKYGRRYGISLEMVVNDDLNAFSQRPYLMADGARRGESLLAVQQAFDANGPHASFFTVGNGNIVTGSPALDLAALQTAYTQVRSLKDAEGEPIMIDMVTLVIPPALEIKANNLKNSFEVWLTTDGGDSNRQLHTTNWFAPRYNIAVEPYIPAVVTSGTKGDTSWMLVASPKNGVPAFHFGFMRGRRNPQLFVKDPDAQVLGGGDVSEFEGSFDNDAIEYKLRHIFGASQGNPKSAVASAGQ